MEESEVKEKKDKLPKFLSADEIKGAINKKTGNKNAYNLSEDNPTEVVGWIGSGNRLWDANICEGKVAGLPMGRISMYAAESGVGKSFIAIEHCKCAIDMGIQPVYFCSEPGGIEAEFLEKVLGPERMKSFTYVEINFMEEMFETIDSLLSNTNNKYLFVWDSLAATPSRAEMEGGFDPSTMFAVNARVATLSLRKIMVPLSKRDCTFLILNQVREAIGATKYDKMNPLNAFTTPGGKMVVFCCSLVVYLFSKNTKSNSLMNDSQEKIGRHGEAIIKKSRFRTEGRKIPIGFTWAGDNPHFHDEELWGEAFKERGVIFNRGPRNYIKFKDGTEQMIKFDNWMEYLKDDSFRKKVDEMFYETFINNYKSSVVIEENNE